MARHIRDSSSGQDSAVLLYLKENRQSFEDSKAEEELKKLSMLEWLKKKKT